MTMGKQVMGARCEVVVRPSGSGLETRMVLAVALLTILVCGCVIVLRNTEVTAKVVTAWQVDAFTALRAEELAVFNALHTAAPEIEIFHEDEDNRWPSVDELAGDSIPPFVQDAAWEKSGGMGWSRSIIFTTDKHIALYVGHPSGTIKMGSFLLVMLHDHVKKEGNAVGATHAPYEIWMHASSVAEAPLMITDQALIKKGWREVVARKGEDETMRTKKDYIQ